VRYDGVHLPAKAFDRAVETLAEATQAVAVRDELFTPLALKEVDLVWPAQRESLHACHKRAEVKRRVP
jgi:hypothetical protein